LQKALRVNMVTSFIDKVVQSCQRLGGRDGMVVAVSGGPDSVALLRALAAWRFPERPGRLVVAHLNHQLRGEESNLDAAFVEDLCRALQCDDSPALVCRVERIDVAARAKAEKANVEGLARRLRYDWLAEVARQEGLGVVATGHTADDQAETVLHRLLRGTGLKGLRGIAERRELAPGVTLIRPLLHVRRQEVLAFLQQERQPFRHDASNDDLRFTRNRIRHELLPHLAGQFNPGIVDVLCRLAEGAQESFGLREADAAALLREAERPRAGGRIILDRNRLAAAPRNLVREAFRLIWSREGWPSNGMNFAAWDRLAGLVFGESPAVDLPGNIRACREKQVVQLG
jgi:tRNA(Ile)-lysidine synthase